MRDGSPQGGSGTDLRTQAIVCQSYARMLLETRFSARLKRDVRVDTDVLTIGTFGQFEARVDNPTSICAYEINGGQRGAVEIEQSLSFSIVDLLMGGRGYPPVETRPLSPLEQGLLGDLFQTLGEDMERAWRQLVPDKWVVAQEAQFTYALDGFMADDPMIIAAYDVGIEGLAQGAVHVALPVSAVVSPEHRATPRGEEDLLSSPLAAGLPLRLAVVLPPVEVTVEELLDVDVGDVLEFGDWEVASDEAGGMEVIVHVEGKPCYRGQLGIIHRKKAVEITESIGPEDIRVLETH